MIVVYVVTKIKSKSAFANLSVKNSLFFKKCLNVLTGNLKLKKSREYKYFYNNKTLSKYFSITFLQD